ncbi:Gfo/Idh/MocA family protein [Arcticibacterium luteifluviistationis]|uniref:Oxidoreductase n=1 Tax=Arcticibacterium luteifluviistationis TaxID=1784714 RepID=A0A2Z4G8E8_9BACT|nr:Gfo/Idh/MocA family oxidoreductase [Arcticibacterium luteifluviistationis]AWV97375.1 oxidoreductase [Arcticibacterium luteifluviistationis]
MKSFNLDRRKFIKGTAAASLAISATGAKAMSSKKTAPKYNVALIGTGWYGTSDLLHLIQVADVEVVSLCDVDTEQLDKAATRVSERQKSGKRPELYSDYKKMLKEQKLDVVLIGSPDHWHALMAIDTIKAGAHVYLQKPISVDVIEGEAILAAARKYNRVVQVGTQRRSTPFLKEAKEEIVDKGLLGKISHVEVCCYYHMRNGSNPPLQDVPAHLDYEMWTGPAPLRPYDGSPHIRWWRAFNEYGNGIMGDMCVHMLDAVRWTMDLGWPKKISSQGGIFVQKDAKSNISDTQSAVFEYEELNVVWQHRTWGQSADLEYPWSYIFYGDKGTLKCSTKMYDFTPVGDGKAIHGEPKIDGKTYPEDLKEEKIEIHAANANRAHMRNFLDAIENGGRPVADIEQGHISTAACILANISMDLGGRPLVYDPKKHIVVGDKEATALLQRPYRKGYIHPHPDRV